MKTFLSLFSIALALAFPAQAQLIVQNGKPVAQEAPADSGVTRAKTQEDTRGPVEAVIGGTDYPVHAITGVDAEGRVGLGIPETPETTEPVKKPAPKKTQSEADPAWPRDTVRHFVLTCATTHKELVEPCRCAIRGLMERIPHDEFLRLSDDGTIIGDARYQEARKACVGKPQQAE
jgi:hypothetical protein